ncbi:4'-phosphopantetheinyl transferase family protein [Kitasatospora mediocidica]|uniref:4'-phosphopantetheinyl transferase family protein n=1 Tax=Kitasatospora mediocidica TaxID=58352 RepID=UPI0018DD4838|nr:4'-phosphopantetheinyl transferase superfamily protein [Kitasatospora mediocidica]
MAHGRVIVRFGRSTAQLVSGDLDILSAEERERFSAFRNLVRAVHFAGAHAGVRRFLARELGCRPAEIRFDRHPCAGCGRVGHGRPYIRYPRTGWELSLSRSGPYWLCAAADGVRVGVDLEPARRTGFAPLAPAVLSASERGYLAALPEHRRAAGFVRCWTRKEAVLKAGGIGVEAALAGVDVAPGERRARVRLAVPGCEVDSWLVEDLRVGPDHVAALAVAEPGV